MQIQPQPLTNEIIAATNQLKDESPFFLSDKDPRWFRWTKLKNDSEKLRKVEPWAGWSVLGTLFSMVGNVEEMNRSFRASLDLKLDETTLTNWVGNLSNCGQFTFAQELFEKYAHPRDGRFGSLAISGIQAHAFHKVLEYSKVAEGMKMKINVPFEEDNLEELVALLSQHGITDSDIAKHLDIAGRIMLSHKLAFSYYDQFKRVPGIKDSVTVAIGVPFSEKEIFDMNIELAKAEDESKLNTKPFFDVVFSSLPA